MFTVRLPREASIQVHAAATEEVSGQLSS
jgi:hypothetical protein